MSNFFIDIAMAIIGMVQQLSVFIFTLVLVYLVLNFVIKLLKKEQFRTINVDAYKDWVSITKNTKSKRMRNLWVVGTKKMSESKIDKIHGYAQAELPEPDKANYTKGKKGEAEFKQAMKDFNEEKKKGLTTLHIFSVASWWNLLDKKLLYVIPEALLVDDTLVGDIFVNCAGYIPCLHYWRLPSNINRKRYVDAIKTNSIYIAYEQDWDYIGNIAQRAIEAENQFLKAKGIKESVMSVFGRGDKKK